MPIPSGADQIRDQITRLVSAIQQPDEPCVVHRGQPYLWLPAVVCALDIPYLELDEDDQAAFMETVGVGHWLPDGPDGETWLMVSLKEVVGTLVFLGRSAHALAYVQWLRDDFYPAMLAHGAYDPARGHAAPIGKEIDQLEVRERCRSMVEHFLSHLHEGDHLYE